MGCCGSKSETASAAIGAGNTKVHVGPLEIDSSGVVVKPKFNLGIAGGSIYALAGVRDVRDGIAAETLAMYVKSYASSGKTLVEFLRQIKAQEPLPVLDDIIASLPQIASQVVETAGADIQKEDVLGVEGVVYIYVGAGVTAGVYLGWVDTSGYRMIGAEGTIATGAGLGVTLRAGMNEDKMAVRVVAYLSNVGFDIIVKYPQPQGK
ncbi:unnamed protein product [Effrenium voratum]|uniref:Uncharacterized protein n=1 Tax=Effrenium voratum TaxID=2562239 RepID=A0AA36IK06_9DINO|nr:unnamed protein product [Effrenium voratum]CAJ1450685.1 unnamed protein product [Effrenium voratum]